MTRYLRPRIAIFGFVAMSCGALLIAAPATQDPAPPQSQDSGAVKQLKETRICKKCDLRGANLMAADLYGAQLQEADLTAAALNEANLELANLTGAIGVDFTGARTDKRTVCPDGSSGPCK